MAEQVLMVGAARTDFARNWKKEGTGLREAVREAALGAVVEAGLEPAAIEAGVVGSFAPGLFTRQLHVGALLAEAHPDWRGLASVHVEAACASGSMALATAAEKIWAGRAGVVMVVGVEQQKTMSPTEVGDVMGAAGDYARERPQYGELPIPKMFAALAGQYLQATGAPAEMLARVAVKNRGHARRNPLAQNRDKPLDLADACVVTATNAEVAAPLRVADCSPITDGAAAVVLASESAARRLGCRRAVRLLGLGVATDHLALSAKDPRRFDVSRRAVAAAYAMAGVGPSEIDSFEVHDCFSITELIAYEILGLAEIGEGWRLMESGATQMGGRVPVNVGGGLIGDGHPVGATGVRQAHECYVQLTDQAGARQIAAVRRMATWNMGGTLTTTGCLVWGRP